MKIPVTALVILFFISLYGFGQTNPSNLPNIIPPSPEARKFIEYGNIPISYNTGVPNINIPLYSFKAGSIEIPLNLSYHASGVKVNDPDGLTGLKWSLTNGGGSINRTVNGRPDEDTANQISGWLNASQNLNLDNLDDISDLNQAYIEGGCVDLQPDEFHFTLPTGLSGKFVFSEDREIIQIPKNENVKVEFYDNYLFSQGWKITDTNGIQYLFSTFDSNNYSTGGGYQDPCPITYVKSSWMLDTAILPNGEQIHYSYINDTYQESFTQSESQFLTELIPNDYNQLMSDFINNFLPNFHYANNYFNLKLLSNIQYKGVRIDFSYSSKSSSENDGRKLDKIDIKYSDQHVQGYDFEYYFNSDNRMFLNTINLISNNQTTTQLYREFEYNNMEDLPERGSFSVDQFGYYNGKSNSRLIAEGTYTLGDILVINPDNNSGCDLVHVNISGANRDLDETKINTATLSKIIYPTKGWTTFEHEPNMGYYGQQEAQPNSFSFSRAPFNNPLGWQIHYSNTFLVANNELEFTSFKVTLFNETGDPGLNWQRPSFDLIDANDVVYYNRTLYSEGENIDNCEDVKFTNLPNGNYRLRVNLYNSDPNISSPYVYSVQIKGNTFSTNLIYNKYFGGIRIKSITNNDSNDTITKKTYNYSSFLNSQYSSGQTIGKFASFKEEMNFNYLINAGQAIIYAGNQNFTKISSTIAPTLAYSRNSPVLYENVEEVFEGNNDSYSIKRYYKNFGINHLSLDLPIKTGKLFAPHSLEGYSNGILWKEELINNNNQKVKETIHDYSFINLPNDGVTGSIIKCYKIMSVSSPLGGGKECKRNEYEVLSRWFVNKKATTTSYFNAGDLIQQVENFYDNPVHKQLSRKETTTSDDKTIITKTFYPDDVSTTTSLENDDLTIAEKAAIDLLKTQHRIATPIQIESTITNSVGTLLSKNTQRTNFRDWGNNIVLPEFVQTLKGAYSSSNTLDDRIIYHNYDDKGNPIEVSKIDGTHIVYIWGYGEQYPIAKIENTTYSQVQSYITNLQNLSDIDIDEPSENSLKEALNNLRVSLPNTMTTTYTYNPLIGVTSITDPRGYSTYYEYDEFNRLKQVKDAQGKILSKNEYHYKD